MCISKLSLNYLWNFFYPFAVSVNKFGGSYNTIDDPHAGVFFPKKIKNINLKVFNLMWRVNETRFILQNESWEGKCGLNESAYNSK